MSDSPVGPESSICLLNSLLRFSQFVKTLRSYDINSWIILYVQNFLKLNPAYYQNVLERPVQVLGHCSYTPEQSLHCHI